MKKDLIFYTNGFYREHFYETLLMKLIFIFISYPREVIVVHYKSRIATVIRDLWWITMTMVKSGLKVKGLTKTISSLHKYKCEREKNIDISVSFIQHGPLVCVLH